MLSDGGDSVVYNFSNLRAWSAEWGKTLTVKVSAGAGLVTDYSFVTPESVQILAVLERNACEVARQAINASLPGAAESKLVSGAGGIAEAELAAKLQALMEEKRTQESAPTEGGPAVNTETLGALKTTQSELAKTKARLDAARSALDAKDKEVKKTLFRLGPFVFLQSSTTTPGFVCDWTFADTWALADGCEEPRAGVADCGAGAAAQRTDACAAGGHTAPLTDLPLWAASSHR